MSARTGRGQLGAGCPAQPLGRKHGALRVTLLYWVPSHNSDIAWEPPGAAGSVLLSLTQPAGHRLLYRQ